MKEYVPGRRMQAQPPTLLLLSYVRSPLAFFSYSREELKTSTRMTDCTRKVSKRGKLT